MARITLPGLRHSTILLAKAARRMYIHRHPEAAAAAAAASPHSASEEAGWCAMVDVRALQPGLELWERFTAAEAELIWRRFEHIDVALPAVGETAILLHLLLLSL